MATSPDRVPEGVPEQIDALATRYELSDRAASTLYGFVRLVDWGEPNFVPKTDPDRRRRDRRRPAGRQSQIASGLLAETLAGLELEPVRGARRLADMGSGAGFPGLVLATVLPEAHVTLIEKRQETCRFLRRATSELGLDDKVEVVEGTVQGWSEGLASCDVVTSRKAGHLDTMVEWAVPLLAPGGAVALWPGTSDFAEDAVIAGTDAAHAAGLEAQVHPLPTENRHGKRVVKHLYLYVRADES